MYNFIAYINSNVEEFYFLQFIQGTLEFPDTWGCCGISGGMEEINMEIQEWRRLAIQSIAFFAVVFVSSLGFSQRIQQSLEVSVQAEDQRETKTREIVFPQEKKEAPTVATKALVEERSNTYIKVPKEKIVSPTKVYLQNKYMDFQVILTLQGVAPGSIDVGDILRVRGYHVSSGKVSKKDPVFRRVEVSGQQKKDSEKNSVQLKFTVKKAYEPILFESDEAYYISLLAARKAHNKIVVVDAGHGGMDEGTSSVNRKHYEKDIVLGIQEKLSKLLDKTDVTVYYTRTSDEKISKKDRTRLANALQADVFVSIHCNALKGGGNTCGVETLYSRQRPKYGKLANRKLADEMLDQVTASTGRKKRGMIQRDGLYLLHHAKVPTTIVEVGYMTNQGDMNFMKKENGQQKIAEGIYQGILNIID